MLNCTVGERARTYGLSAQKLMSTLLPLMFRHTNSGPHPIYKVEPRVLMPCAPFDRRYAALVVLSTPPNDNRT